MRRDSLGDRMKRDYENRTRFFLPRRTYTLIRCDGKAFHNYTRGLARPFDSGFMADMDATAARLCGEIGGARMAYVQSDEISLLLTDFDSPQTEAWFDGNLQKMASIAAAIATAELNRLRPAAAPDRSALFDARVWTIPDRTEVCNYFIWRQQDATRNSISMTACAHFPQGRLHSLSCDQLQELLWREKDLNWNDQPVGFKRGRVVLPVVGTKDVEYVDRRTQELRTAEAVQRRSWQVVEPPVFTQDREWLLNLIPPRE